MPCMAGWFMPNKRNIIVRKILIFICATLILFSMSGIATASYFFDFEDETSTYGPLSVLETYMEGIFGSDITVKRAFWWGESFVYGSDIIYTKTQSAVLDFDPLAPEMSTFDIDAVSFKWLVLDTTHGIDFGLDVFDDASHSWIKNIFHVNHVGNIAFGFTGKITFEDNLEITRLRIHDSGILDVGMDNLKIYSAPIPGTVWMFGAGLVSIVGIRRKLRK